jgi:glucokinase
VLDADDTVLAEHRVPTPRTGPALLDALSETVRVLRDAVPSSSAVGIGVPGLVDRAGRLRFAPNLPGIVELDVGPEVARRTGLPVAVDNDNTAAVAGEHALGAARGVDDAVLLGFGTGIGAGLLLGGTVVRGANGFAGEAGHMVVQRDGVPCPCGRRGCWERYASGSGIGRNGRAAAEAGRAPRLVALAGGDPLDVRGEHVTLAAAEGDAVALEVVRDFADWVAVGLVNLVQLLDVGMFVVAGGVAESADVLLPPIRDAYAQRAVAAEHRPPVRIVGAALGERAGAVGAALLARSLPS